VHAVPGINKGRPTFAKSSPAERVGLAILLVSIKGTTACYRKRSRWGNCLQLGQAFEGGYYLNGATTIF
jgi:hypothetical protein